MKQSRCDFEVPEHKEITNRTTLGPTTDTDSQVPIIWNRLRREPSFCLRTTQRRAIKEESKIINYDSVNNHAYSLPQNYYVVTDLFVANPEISSNLPRTIQ